MSVIRVVKKFSSILSKHQKLRIFELLIMMIAGGLLEMCSVSLVLPFMDVVMKPEEAMDKWYSKLLCEFLHINSERAYLIAIAFLLAGMYIVKNIYLVFEYNIQYKFVYRNMFDMQKRLLYSFLHRPYEYFLNVNSGEIIRVVNSDTVNAFVLLSTILNLFTEFVVSGMLIINILMITPFITICIAIALLILVLIASIIIKPILKKAGVKSQMSSAGMNKWLLQSVNGIKEIKVMSKEKYFQNNYNKWGKEYVAALRRNQVVAMMPRFMIEAVCMSVMFIVVAMMIIAGNQMENIVPVVTAVAMAALRLLPSVNRITGGIASMAYSEPMLDKLIENLDTIKLIDTEKTEENQLYDMHSGSTENYKMKYGIDMEAVSYRYPNSNKNVLDKAALTVHAGESIGIIGSSGSGKTTAVDILLGLLTPLEGKILVDGIDINTDQITWHQMVGYIPQTIFLLDDTIKRNICFGVDDELISEEKIWEVLKEASLYDYVMSLPDGIQTEIGERGVRLSGGQKQRMGIARALYRNPQLLIFDEATSSLDSDTEAAIMKSIYYLHGKKTMIIIAHRLSTLDSCDRIYRVAEGAITEV